MRSQDLDFDIDHYLNRFIPRNRLHLLPKPISWFLGYRDRAPARIGNILVWWWAFISAFAGILVVEAVFQTKQLRSEGTPIIIASFGAAAVLNYHTIDSPLSQPRNAVLGHTLSAVVGMGITKLFQHSPHFESLRWIAGALSVGVASAVMGITKTIHPPAGATALLCSTSPDITALGWFLIPLVILGSSLFVAVGCVSNNIQRRYPTYWWTPSDLGVKSQGEIERAVKEVDGDSIDTAGTLSFETRFADSKGMITINGDHVIVPNWLPLDYKEREMLGILRIRLRESRGTENMVSRTEMSQVHPSSNERNDGL